MILTLIFLINVICYTNGAMPVVIWHGMGDTCCNPLSMGSIVKLIKAKLPNTYVLSLEIGGNIAEDEESGFFGDVNKQIESVCHTLIRDVKLRGGFNAIGFSQGGQFLRAVAQRCPWLGMYNLISIGGQHQGVYGFPHCPGRVSLCNIVRKVLNYGAYTKWVQRVSVQAQYWHDPLNEAEYIKYSRFLADINNERTINKTYRDNLVKLNNFVMVKFLKDTMVIPRESEWFDFYKPGQASIITPLRNSSIYINDRIGLRKLDKANKLKFLTVDGDHLRFSQDWFIKSIINPYLNT